MASGLSKRFGSNKLLARFQGRALLDIILDNTEGLFARRVVVTRSEAAAELCRHRGVEVLLHTLPGRNDAVRLGTTHLQDMDALVFCPCDQPLLRRESLKALLTSPHLRTDTIGRLVWQDRQGTPMVFGREYFPALCSLPTGKGGGYVAGLYPERVFSVSVGDPAELRDIDTPEDLKNLLRIAETDRR